MSIRTTFKIVVHSNSDQENQELAAKLYSDEISDVEVVETLLHLLKHPKESRQVFIENVAQFPPPQSE